MKKFTCNELIQALSGEASAEGEILLPDYCPPVMKVIGVSATPFLRSQTVRGDRLYADGSVEFRIVYISDAAPGLQTVSHRLPFSYSAQVGASDESVFATVSVSVEYRSARALSPQKLYAKAAVALSASIYAPVEAELPDDDAKNRAELLKTSVFVTDVVASSTRTLRLTEDIDAGDAKIEKMLRFDVEFPETEQKPVNKKLIVKADMLLCLTYADEDGKVGTFETKIPVSQLLDIPGFDEKTECSTRFDLSDITVSTRRTEKENILSLDAEVTITAECFRSEKIELIKDAFSLTENAECVTKPVSLQSVRKVNDAVEFRNDVELTDFGELVDAAVRPSVMSVSFDAERGGAASEGVFGCDIIYRNTEGELCSVEKAAPFSIFTPLETTPTSMKSNCRLVITSISKTPTATGIELRISALHVGSIVTVSTQTAVADITFTPCEKKKNREFVSYMAEEGDSLWEIAKKFRVPPEKLAELNGIDGDAVPRKQMIFIAP